MREVNPQKKSLDEFNCVLLSALKEICCLPQKASQAYFFSHKKAGGLSMFDPQMECDVQAIVKVFAYYRQMMLKS